MSRADVRQFYLGCLAQASYMVVSDGEAAVIDPRRDVEIYAEAAAERGAQIRHVIETHLHADFVSGHRELAAETGATIHVSRAAAAGYPHHPLAEGTDIRVGSARLRVLETPGHTRDSICLLLFDGDRAEPRAVFTGDTLFIGDVGRPDLAAAASAGGEPATSAGGEPATPVGAEPATPAGGEPATPEAQAGQLYDSLHEKILALPDAVVVYPGHGAGSMCGRNLSTETISTIGEQRRHNYALQPMAREAFVRMMTTDLPEVPAYFGRDVRTNREGPALLSQLSPAAALSAEEVERLARAGAVVLDTRPSASFGAAHVPGALQIGLDGQFASWAGTVISAGAKIVLVAESAETVEEARLRLARVGLDSVAGFLEGGIAEWHAKGLPLASTEQITVQELALRLDEGACRVLDVRRPAEWSAGHIADAFAHPLADLARFEPTGGAPMAVICAGGFRSAIAASLLEQRGVAGVANVVGGMAAWNAAGLPTIA